MTSNVPAATPAGNINELASQTLTNAPPPHPLDNLWMLRIDGHEYGPFDGHELEEFAEDGRLEPSTDVRRKNGIDWVSAETDRVLARFFKVELPAKAAPAAPVTSTATGSGAQVINVSNNVQIPAGLLADVTDKSPGVALLLSFLFCGAGQCYNGEVGKGILMFFGCLLLWLALLGWIINIWSMIDAWTVASRKHRVFNASQAQLRAAAA